jgi:carnitine O-acetyltransferase
VPSLEITLAQQLESSRALLSQEEAAATASVLDEFLKEGGVGQELQERLVKLDEASEVRIHHLVMPDKQCRV